MFVFSGNLNRKFENLSWLVDLSQEIFAEVCSEKTSNCPKKLKIRNYQIFVIFVIEKSFESLRVLKAPDDISSYAVRPLKKNFVVSQVEQFLKVTDVRKDRQNDT